MCKQCVPGPLLSFVGPGNEANFIKNGKNKSPLPLCLSFTIKTAGYSLAHVASFPGPGNEAIAHENITSLILGLTNEASDKTNDLLRTLLTLVFPVYMSWTNAFKT